jgi:hypothetical protein
MEDRVARSVVVMFGCVGLMTRVARLSVTLKGLEVARY